MTVRQKFSDCEERELTAIILCGGRGQGLRPLSDTVPKPFLPVNGRPNLDYLLEQLSQRAPGLERFRCLNSGDVGIIKRLTGVRPLVRGRALVCHANTLVHLDVCRSMESNRNSRTEATITDFPIVRRWAS